MHVFEIITNLNPNLEMSLKGVTFENSDDVMLLARIAEQSEQYDDMIDLLKPHFE